MKFFFPLTVRVFISIFVFFIALYPVYGQKKITPSKNLTTSNLTKKNSSLPKPVFVWADEAIYRAQLKKDGTPPQIIEKLIKESKELIVRERKTASVQPGGPKNIPPITLAGSPCSGMGAEAGWGAWTAKNGNNNSGTITLGASGAPTSPRFNLTGGAGIDACTPGAAAGAPPIPVLAPGFGNASIQLGQIQTNGSAGNCVLGCVEELTYSLLVGPSDGNFTFAYAIVMEDPSHATADQPFVSLDIYDAGGVPINCGSFKYISGPGLPGFYDGKCKVNSPYVTHYKPWTLVGVNLTSYIGQTITVRIRNSDCGLGGHFAQSYWDFDCGNSFNGQNIAPFCSGGTSTTITTNFGFGNSYLWSTGQTTSSIVVNPQVVSSVTLTVNPANCPFYETYNLLPTVINPGMSTIANCGVVTFTDATTITNGTIGAWNWSFPGGNPASSTAQNPPPITYSPGSYTATLNVVSTASCSATINVPFTVANNAPTVTVNNATICQGNSATLTASGASTYSWSTTQVINPIIVSPTVATSYTVIGTNAFGCTASAIAAVTVDPPLPVAISVTATALCDGVNTTLTASGGTTYLWSPGGQTATTVIVNSGTYTVTGYSGTCWNTSIHTVAPNCNPYLGGLGDGHSNLVYRALFCPDNPFLGGLGDGHANLMIDLSHGCMPIFTGGIGDGHDNLIVNLAAGCLPIYSGGLGDGHDNLVVNLAFGCLPIFYGGLGDGHDNQVVNLSFGCLPIFFGGQGDGHDNKNDFLSNGCNTVYTGGLGDGHDNKSTSKPVANITAVPSPTLCVGQTATLSGSGGATYLWNTGATTVSITVTPTSTSGYTVTTASACVPTATASATNTVTVNAVPSASVTPTAATINSGNSITLTASGGGTYAWNNGATTSSIVVAPTTNTTYSVTTTNANGCTDVDLVNITVNPTPIELLSFAGLCQDGDIILNWVTATEKNNDHFSIERGEDAINFFSIGQMKGAGNSSVQHPYSFTDPDPLTEGAYYKLTQTDFNGQTFGYFPVWVSCHNIGEFSLTVNPTLVNDGNIFVTVYGPADDGVLLVLTDVLGRKLYSKMIIDASGGFLAGINLREKLSAGVYFVNAASKNELISRKIVVVR